VLQCELPDYWREELSFAFANVSLKEGKNGETESGLNELEHAEFKRRALEMRRDGLSYKKVAGALGVGIKRVRNAVDEVEQGIEGHA